MLLPLYRARFAAGGDLFGARVYVPMDTGLAQFVKLGQAELAACSTTTRMTHRRLRKANPVAHVVVG